MASFFKENSLLDGSISLSPLYPSQTNDLHSVSLRASTRVSPGFALLRHSSPSFGSQQICSHSNLSASERSVDGAPALKRVGSHLSGNEAAFTFIARQGFRTRTLAYMLDSLVRVSRRVNLKTISSASRARDLDPLPPSAPLRRRALALLVRDPNGTGARRRAPEGGALLCKKTSVPAGVSQPQTVDSLGRQAGKLDTFLRAFSLGQNSTLTRHGAQDAADAR